MAGRRPLVINHGQVEQVQSADLVDISTLPITTDGTLSADSDSLIPTEKAVVTYVQTFVASQHFLQAAIATKTSNYSMTSSDGYILVNGTITITLPDATMNTGKIFGVKNIGTGKVTINTVSSQLIDSSLTQTLSKMESIQCISDGTNWWII